LASLFIGHAAQKSKLHNLQYDEGGNHMAETETETANFFTVEGNTRIIVQQIPSFLQETSFDLKIKKKKYCGLYFIYITTN
jgi:hypothetical protein